MAETAIRGRRNVVYGFPSRRHTVVARLAVVDDSRVIEHRFSEAIGVMADSTVFDSYDVHGHRRPFTRGANAVVVIVARLTRLNRWVDSVVEYTVETESRYAVTTSAVNIHCWVSNDRPGRRHTVAGITSTTDNFRSGVIGVGTKETYCGVAEATLRRCVGMGRRWRFANTYCAIVTA